MSGKLTQDRKWIILIDDLFVALAVDVLGVEIFVVVLIDKCFEILWQSSKVFCSSFS